jgi:ADP-heptose:LPS heptosyltransferase
VSSVLVLRALGLGDFLTGVPALRAIRDAYPDHQIVLAAPPSLQPLAYLSGAVDEVVPAEPLQPVDFRSPDVAVNLHGRGPESHRVLLATRPGRLIAFANTEIAETCGSPVWRAKEHEVDRWCRLLEESGIPADTRRLALPPPQVAPPDVARGATLIHPGAASRARCWPPERWASVARAELAAGRSVAVTAGPGEEEAARQIAREAGLGPDHVIAGPLLEMAAAVAAARIVACADTGVAHLATAFGTPSVIVFGPTPPWLWGPPMWHPHIALWSGRCGDPLADVPDEGLMEIRAEEVIAALNHLRVAA